MVTAAALIAATTLLAKALGTDALGAPLPAPQMAWGRYAFAALAIFAAALWLRPRLRLTHGALHLGRVLCGASAVTLLFAAAARMPLAEATAISFLNPVLAMILAVPLLGERVGPWRWLAAGIALAGAVLLLRPGAGTVSPGAPIALAAAVFMAVEVMFIKRLAHLEDLLATLVWANGLGLTVVSLAALPGWQPPTGAQWAAMGALGLTMAAAQWCYVNALSLADASFVTPLTYLTLVFAGLYDLALFGVLPDAVGWSGAGLIVAGALLLAWREGRVRT